MKKEANNVRLVSSPRNLLCDTCDCPVLMVLLKADLARLSGEGRVAAATGDLGLSRLSTLAPIGVSHAKRRSPPPAAGR